MPMLTKIKLDFICHCELFKKITIEVGGKQNMCIQDVIVLNWHQGTLDSSSNTKKMKFYQSWWNNLEVSAPAFKTRRRIP